MFKKHLLEIPATDNKLVSVGHVVVRRECQPLEGDDHFARNNRVRKELPLLVENPPITGLEAAIKKTTLARQNYPCLL